MMDYIEYSDIVNILLVDDHEVVRAGLRRLLNSDNSIKILAEVSNGLESLDAVKQYNPEVVLMDIQMPKMNGIEATKQIKASFPNVFVIILTAFEDFDHVDLALSAGADGYLSKDVGFKQLCESIHSVTKGNRVYSKSIVKLLQKQLPFSQADSEPISITPREQEILNLVAAGKTSLEISTLLNISVRTAQGHRSNIMQKLNLKTAAGLVRYAVLNATK